MQHPEIPKNRILGRYRIIATIIIIIVPVSNFCGVKHCVSFTGFMSGLRIAASRVVGLLGLGFRGLGYP